MYSAALAPIFQKQPRWFQWLGPYSLIDQVFAMAMTRADEDPDAFRAYYLGASLVYVVGWNATTALGLIVGPRVPESWQLDFAIPLIFLALLIAGINRRTKVVAALVAAAATYLTMGLPNRLGLMIGGIAGVAAGVIAQRMER
jgi:predicted branched-subunit amino acid permease